MNIEGRSSRVRAKSRPPRAGRSTDIALGKASEIPPLPVTADKKLTSRNTNNAESVTHRSNAPLSEETPDASRLETFLLRPSTSDDLAEDLGSTLHGKHGVPNLGFTAKTAFSPTDRSSCFGKVLPSVEADSARAISVLKVTVRVVGADGAGKTNFVKNASQSNTVPVLSDAVTYVVDRCLCKVNFVENVLQASGALKPNDKPEATSFRTLREVDVDGTVLLYHVMDSDTLRGVPELLRSIRASQAAVVLVATNCDNPPSSRDVQPSQITPKARSIIPDIRVYESALFSPEGAIAAVRGVLAEVILSKGLDTHPRTRPRSDSAALALSSTASETPHLRSALSSVTLKTSDTRTSTDFGSRSHSRQHSSSSQLDENAQGTESQASANYKRMSAIRPGLAPKPHSFLILDDISSDDQDQDEEIGGTNDNSRPSKTPTVPSKYSPATFQDLLDMLLRPVPTEEDVEFLHTFLAFYRLFVCPWILLNAIITHYDSVKEDPVTPWVHETILDRDLAVLSTWVQQYPGDFAKPLSRNKLQAFLVHILPEASITDAGSAGGDSGYFSMEPAAEDEHRTVLVHQIKTAFENVAEDEDTDWACSDTGVARRKRANTFLSMSSLESIDDRTPTRRSPHNAYQAARGNYQHDQQLIFGDKTTVTLTAMFRGERFNNFAESCSNLVNIAECAQRQACLLVPTPRRPMDKELWRNALAQSDESIARELTRIDWILFSAIRPRDMIRHATPRSSDSSSGSGSSTPDGISTPSTEHVDRLVNHFNHLACWVTNLILFRDKPKHRAIMLAKLIHVAASLRRLNNYNALGAFVAVIDGPQIKRLKATWALIDPDLRKKLESLKILMSPNRSHWAYRFALESTESVGSPRVPFFPLHRRDLIVAERNARTFMSDDKPPNLASHASSTTTLVESASGKARTPTADPSIRTTNSTSTMQTNSTTHTTTTTATNKSSSSASSSKTIIPATASTTTSSASTSAPPTAPDDCTTCLTPSTLTHRRINWPKFAIMGETLSLLRKAQSCPYTSSESTQADAATSASASGPTTNFTAPPTTNTWLTHNEPVRSLLLETRICKDEDVLWKRSHALEPPVVVVVVGRGSERHGDDSDEEGEGDGEDGEGWGASRRAYRDGMKRRIQEGLGRLRSGKG